MTTYLALRELHRTAVILSFTLFALRGLWMLADSPQLQRRWVRIVPHLIDTVLLASAIGLTLILQQYPFVNGWLTAYLALAPFIGSWAFLAFALRPVFDAIRERRRATTTA